MKTQIRMNCFESNSSSMHSIVTSKTTGIYTPEEFHEDIYIDENDKWYFWDNDLEFGRSPYNILCTFNDKMRYAIASLCGVYVKQETVDKYFDELERIACKYIPECKGFEFDTDTRTEYVRDFDGKIFGYISDRIWDNEEDLENWGCTGIAWDSEERQHFTCREFDYYKTGDVDHQSAGLLLNFLTKYNIPLEVFLTNRKYWVVIDGDECCEFKKQYKHRIINVDNIAEIFPRFLTGNESEEELIDYYNQRENISIKTED